ELVRDSDEFIGGFERAATGEDGNVFAFVQNLRGVFQILFARQGGAAGKDVDVMAGNVSVRAVAFLQRRVLGIGGEIDVGHAAFGECAAAGEMGDIRDVFGAHDARIINRDIHVNAVKVDVLL